MKAHPLLTGCLIAVLVILFFVGVSVIGLKFLGQGKMSLAAGEKVGVVEIKGLISDSKTVLKQLDRFSEDQAIKAIVVRINSPGGAVGPSQEILREVEKVKKKKKVVASLGTVAASGGYYIACGADLIMANKGTATGSIGVIMQFTNVEALTKKVGLAMLEDPELGPIAKKTLSGDTGKIHYTLKGAKKAMAYSGIPLNGWSVQASMPEAEFLATAIGVFHYQL